MENIDDFNLGCALILARLYEAFPVAVTLDVRPLAADAVGDLERIERRRARQRRIGAQRQPCRASWQPT